MSDEQSLKLDLENWMKSYRILLKKYREAMDELEELKKPSAQVEPRPPIYPGEWNDE